MFIFVRLFYVQIIWGNELQEKALDQWTRNIPVLAKRGDILDRNGVVLATTKKTYSVFVRPRAVTDVDGVSTVLSDVFSLDKQALKNKITSTKISEFKVIKHTEQSLVDKLSTYKLNGVYFAEDVTRVYPYNNLLCQTLGYTSNDGNGKQRRVYHNTELMLKQYRNLAWVLETFPEEISDELEQPFENIDKLISRLDVEMAYGNRRLEHRLEGITQARLIIDRINVAVDSLKRYANRSCIA